MRTKVEKYGYAQLVERSDGGHRHDPLSTLPLHRSTLRWRLWRVQLIYVTIILLVLCVGLALLLSRQISEPIIRSTSRRKNWPRENMILPSRGGGYREISELGDTLNYAAKELPRWKGCAGAHRQHLPRSANPR